MGRQLSGILAALWLVIGLAEGALAARPGLKPFELSTARPKAKTKARKKPQTAKRITPRKAQRVALDKPLPKPRKKRTKLTRTRVVLQKPAPKLRKKTTRRVRTQVARSTRAPRRYIRSFQSLVTAYVPINTPMEGGRWTCTMRDGWKTHGIAVDPRYIPLGSLLYVPGYGKALADDTGGRIKGHHIDVRRHSIESMHRWGVKRLRVYVLKHPKKKKRTSRSLSI